MTQPNQTLQALPDGLRNPLIEEYNNIIRNYLEKRWTPSELSGGKFCEIVYSIIQGCSSGTYASSPNKPSNFVDACRRLESSPNLPRSFQILIPRILPALYEIRNNRGVGHAGGEVDPNHMDATAVVAMSSWVIAELVRVFHNLPILEAQKIVDGLVERRVPLVWEADGMKRVLNPKLSLKDQVLLLISSAPSEVQVEDLFKWVEYKNRGYFNRVLRELHETRFVELGKDGAVIQTLPPGSEYLRKLIAELA